MDIYQATKDDLDGLSVLFNLYRQFYKQKSDLEGAKVYLNERLENNDSILFVVKERKSYIGFVQLYPSFSSVAMKKIWILNDLYVHENARKQGVATVLLDKAKSYAMKTGAKRISLSTAIDNAVAQKLYEKNGYKKETQFYYYDLVLD